MGRSSCAGFDPWLLDHRTQMVCRGITPNETCEAPSDQQIRWHIMHMREDLHILVLSNYVLTVAVIAILLFR